MLVITGWVKQAVVEVVSAVTTASVEDTAVVGKVG